MITIQSLSTLTFDQLAEAFQDAFGSYDVQINKEELRTMLHRRGFTPELSFGAFDQDKLVAFTFNGIGNYNAIRTAYDTGTGTTQAYRGKGIASDIFRHSIPFLQQAGVKQYLLEVLQHNESAMKVYSRLGFETVREFNYFRQESKQVNITPKTLPAKFTVKDTSLDISAMQAFWNYPQSWQNNFEAVERCLDHFIIKGAFYENKLIGYCVFEPNSGDVTQLAVDKFYRRKGVATALLQEVMKTNKTQLVKIINTETSDTAFTAFLAANGIKLSGKQFEMIKVL